MCNLMEMVPGCQADLIASHPLFSREISCPVADKTAHWKKGLQGTNLNASGVIIL